jgi:hypothetical protein
MAHIGLDLYRAHLKLTPFVREEDEALDPAVGLLVRIEDASDPPVARRLRNQGDPTLF